MKIKYMINPPLVEAWKNYNIGDSLHINYKNKTLKGKVISKNENECIIEVFDKDLEF